MLSRFLLGLCVAAASAAWPVWSAETGGALSSRCPAGEPWTDEVVAQATGMDLSQLEHVKRMRSLDNAMLCEMPEAALQRAMWRADHPKPDHPGEWAQFRAAQQADEHGRVRPDGLMQAMAVRKQILERSSRAGAASRTGTGTRWSVAGSSTSLATAAAPGAAWTSIGPGNIGGRVRALLIHPGYNNSTNKTLWAGSVAGGIWRTDDAGASWLPVNDFMANLSVSSLVMSPTNTSVLYAGTGEGFYNADAVRGAGVFKSTDGGVTWNQLANTAPTVSASWYYVNRLAIHPTAAPDTLLAATNSGIYRSTDGGGNWSGPVLSGRYLDVRFDPQNGDYAVAGNGSGTVAYSSNAGASWSTVTLPGGSGRVEVAFSGDGVVYAVSDASNGTGVGNGKIYRSSDHGVTWTLQSSPAHLGSQGWYDNALWVDPTNSAHVLVGGIDLYRSTDSGLSWTRISNWTNSSSVHSDHHAIVSAPGFGSSNRTVYFGNDGGVYRADDITLVTTTATPTGWTKLNNGLAITQFYSGAGHNGNYGRIIGGTQDNYSLVYAGTGTSWSPFFGGDGGFSAIDPTDGRYIYGEYVYLQIHRSTNGGSTQGSYIYSGITDAGSAANFIAPFMLDPNNPNVMLAGGYSLWRSSNVKATPPTWSRIYTGSGTGSGPYISQIAVAASNSDVVWFGTNNGTIMKTVNGTQAVPTWNAMANPVPGRRVLSILIDKDNPDTVYLGLSGYNSNNLWRSTNGGSSWVNIGGGLPPSPIRTVQRHPSDALTLYAGTEVGVFTSQDGGNTWSTTNDGPANVSVDQLFWLDSSTLVAATHGRGMFKATMSPGSSYQVTVSKTGAGTGTVTSNLQPGINCGSTCTASFGSSASVVLSAAPASGSTLKSWTGCNATSGTSCTVSSAANVPVNVTATFDLLPPYTVSVSVSGSGTVSSSPAGISCGSTCSASFNAGSTVTLTAVPATGYTFAGWTGCSAASGTSCTVTSAASVSATFTGNPTLTVTKTGTGTGTVTSSPAGINCGSTCTASYALNTKVTLTAKPAKGGAFKGWSGACAGTSTKCTVTMSSSKSVGAAF